MRNQILTIIKEEANKQKVNINLSEANLNKPLKELGVDSIYVFGLIVAIEDKLGLKLPNEVWVKIKTINELIAAFEQIKK